MAKIWSDGLSDALREAGLADTNTRRVIIDLQVGHAAVVHIEKYGDRSILKVIEAMTGVDVVRVEDPK
jgi:hypothetical protein